MSESKATADHPLLTDLLTAKGDQVASLIRYGVVGWLTDVGDWPVMTEGRYDRDNKKRNATFSIFSNLGEAYGLPVKEEPFFQLEVDRHTKQRPPMKDIPFGFGIDRTLLEYPVLRDMVYPYLYLSSILTRYRKCTIIAIYKEAEDRPLQIDLLGGQSIYRVMLWQNRLIREYNEIVKHDPSFHIPPDGKLESYSRGTDEPGVEEEEHHDHETAHA